MNLRPLFQTKLYIPYLYICGVLWMISYWSTFGINIFEYIDIADVIKLIIYPLIIGAASYLIVFILQFAMTFSDKPDSNDGPDIFFLRNRRIRIIVEGVYILVLLTLYYISSSKFKSLYLPLIATPLIAYYIFKTKLLQENFSVNIQRWFISFLIVIIPAYSFTESKKRSLEIFENKKFSFTYITTQSIDSLQVKYLGKAGNFYIFISPDNSKKYFKSTTDDNILELEEK